MLNFKKLQLFVIQTICYNIYTIEALNLTCNDIANDSYAMKDCKFYFNLNSSPQIDCISYNVIRSVASVLPTDVVSNIANRECKKLLTYYYFRKY